jgi:hypothetical protein
MRPGHFPIDSQSRWGRLLPLWPKDPGRQPGEQSEVWLDVGSGSVLISAVSGLRAVIVHFLEDPSVSNQ